MKCCGKALKVYLDPAFFNCLFIFFIMALRADVFIFFLILSSFLFLGLTEKNLYVLEILFDCESFFESKLSSNGILSEEL